MNWHKFNKKEYENIEYLSKKYIEIAKNEQSNQLPNLIDYLDFIKIDYNNIIYIINNNYKYNNEYINLLINLIKISIININDIINKYILNVNNNVNIKLLELIIKNNNINQNNIINEINKNNYNQNNISIIYIYKNEFIANENIENDKIISLEQNKEMLESLKVKH